MKTGIVIVSGFLGAGKTTLIEKLLREHYQGRKVALIENDFGEVGVDAALLGTSGVQVREINAGCICCTLTGDFVRALAELISRYQPEEILIEPSGVGKLSDVVAACADPAIAALATVRKRITVVDAGRFRMYLDNFGEFFEDQVAHADVLLLSRMAENAGAVQAARTALRELNEGAAIVDWPLATVTAQEILEAGGTPILQEHTHTCGCGHDHSHAHEPCTHEHHGEGCTCHEHEAHHADEVFDTVTVAVQQALTEQQVRTLMAKVEQTGCRLLRAKGLVPTQQGYLNVQYLPGELHITPCEVAGQALCFIGSGLNQPAIERIFAKE